MAMLTSQPTSGSATSAWRSTRTSVQRSLCLGLFKALATGLDLPQETRDRIRFFIASVYFGHDSDA